MRLLAIWAMLLVGVGCVSTGRTPGASIKKVLPHYLDQSGRHVLHPSLYERDAYQYYLKRHPEEQSGIRFDTLIKAPESPRLVLKLELRGTMEETPTRATAESEPYNHKGGSSWVSASLTGAEFRRLGDIVAWRATLWSGDLLLTEQTSFLW